MVTKQGAVQAFLTGDQAPVAASAAAYIALAGTLWPSITALSDSISSHSVLDASAWILYILTVVIWFMRTLIRKTRKLLPLSEKFSPFADIEDLKVWPRDAAVAQLTALIRKETDHLPIVVGPSGAGKTVILRRLLPEALGLGPANYLYVDEYDDVSDVIERYIAHKAEGTPRAANRVIVLDQFEQYIAQVRDHSLDKQAIEWKRLRTALDQAQAKGFNCVISLRHEWYYHLRPLGDLVPAPNECAYVVGPVPGNPDDQTLRAFMLQLRGVLGEYSVLSTEVLESLGGGQNISLLEAQIVGSTLESLKRAAKTLDREYFRDEIGGVDGAIDLYFDEILAGAPDRRISLKVLAALSTATQFRRQQDTTRIYDALFEDDAAIGAAITYLKKRGLVIDRTGFDQIELVHDYVAAYFHRRCGHELRPTDRDNVVYHVEAGPAAMGKVVLSRAARSCNNATFGRVLFGGLFTLMIVRLLGFGIPWTRVGDITPRYAAGSRIFDEAYVPIFLAHGAWAIYIALFYARLLSMLNERGFAKLFTRAVPVFMAGCVIVAMFIPYAWMLSIGLGGVFLSGKLLSLSRNKELGAGARQRMLEFGRTTAAALAFWAALGALGMSVSFALQNHRGFESHWIAYSIFAGIMTTVPCLALAPYHIQPPAVAEFLGQLARSPRSFVDRRRPDEGV